ncbi:MAG: hypothetical protein LWY06_02835 [Firmicutes bacterium]|nr:hypothetical protein [Bacillota bacterium]
MDGLIDVAISSINFLKPYLAKTGDKINEYIGGKILGLFESKFSESEKTILNYFKNDTDSFEKGLLKIVKDKVINDKEFRDNLQSILLKADSNPSAEFKISQKAKGKYVAQAAGQNANATIDIRGEYGKTKK